jgi:hypothetical protein
MTIVKTANDFVAIAGNYQTHAIRWQLDAYQQSLQEHVKKHSSCSLCHLSGEVEFFLIDGQMPSQKSVESPILVCQYCMKLKLFDQYTLDYQGKDRLIYLPQLTQAELHHFYHVCHQLQNESGGQLKIKAIIAELQGLSLYLDELAGVPLSHPGGFVHFLHSASVDKEFLMNIRWLDGELLKSEFE